MGYFARAHSVHNSQQNRLALTANDDDDDDDKNDSLLLHTRERVRERTRHTHTYLPVNSVCTMGQDGEAARELVATMRDEHQVMKAWFQGDSPEAGTLRQKYGNYPGLWKEVLNWPGWKEARKAYLQHTQKNEGSTSAPRKRRSRWGNADNGQDSENTNAANKRRSRWGNSSAPPSAPSAPPPAVRGPMLPALPLNMSPHQQQEVKKLQGRLREVNQKLSTIEQEAARVDALPRGHRERSPSPPPGMYQPNKERERERAKRWNSHTGMM